MRQAWLYFHRLPEAQKIKIENNAIHNLRFIFENILTNPSGECINIGMVH